MFYSSYILLHFDLCCVGLIVHTIKRIFNWPLYKIWYYATYLINASKVWLLWIVHTNISTNGKKKHFHVQNCPCGTVGAKIGYVLGLLVHDNVVVESGRKVFLVDCLLRKTLNIVEKVAMIIELTCFIIKGR